jgi:hypothetical protein
MLSGIAPYLPVNIRRISAVTKCFRRKSKKGKKRFSNRFWPSLTKYIQSIDNNFPDLLPGDYNSKKNLMRKLNFACLDLIKSVEVSEDKKADIIGNGYKDQPLFSTTTKRHYSTKDIVLLIKEKKIKKVIASWGAFTDAKNPKSVRAEVNREINKIKDSSPNTVFKIDIDGSRNLPPFGKPLVTELVLGKLIYEEII